MCVFARGTHGNTLASATRKPSTPSTRHSASSTAPILHVLVEWAGRGAFGLAGIAAGMAVTTAVALAVMLVPLGSLHQALQGLIVAATVCGGLAALTFGVSGVVLDAVAAALLGLAVYALGLSSWRPVGLLSAWAYARTLR